MKNPAPRTSDARPLRVAIAGLGIGRAHARALAELAPDVELCAFCDRDRARLRRVGDEFGVAARHADLGRLLAAERPDAVVVATPNHLHEPMAVAALEAGADVLVEKPLAHTLAAARRIEQAARRTGRFAMLDLSFRFSTGARTIRRFLDAGRCGPLYHASSYWCRTRGIPDWGGWFCDRKRSGGGPVIDLGVHRIDLALWFLGEPAVESVSAVAHGRLGRALARGGRGAGKRFGVEDFGGGILRCAGDRSVVFEVSWAENSGRREVMLTRVLGVAGGAVERNREHTYEFQTELYADRRGRLVAVDPEPWTLPALRPAQVFARAVRSGERAGLPDARTGLALQRVLAAIYLSAEEGREVAPRELDG